MNDAAPSRRFLATHNALRGIAALAVVIYHVELAPGIRFPGGPALPALLRGYVWVDFFFMLSGFVLAMRYGQSLGRGGAREIRAFVGARVARIVPLHIATLALLAVVVAATTPGPDVIANAPYWRFLALPDWSHLALQAALVQIWHAPATLSWNIPSWSISAEMHVYLLFPIVAWALARWPKPTAVIAFATVVAIYAGISTHLGSLDVFGWVALPRCLAGFLLGVLCRRIDAGASFSGLVAGALQAVALLWIVAVLSSPHHDVAVVPGLALLVLATAHDKGWLAAALAGRPLQRLGDMSYSLYLLNFPVLLIAAIARPVVPVDAASRYTWSALLIATLIAASYATYRWIEVPARATIRRSMSSPGATGRAQAVATSMVEDPAP